MPLLKSEETSNKNRSFIITLEKEILAVDFNAKENLKVAVACENGEVVRDLGQTEQLMLFDTEDGKIQKQNVVDFKKDEADSFGGHFSQNGVNVLICNQLTNEEAEELRNAGVLTYAGNSGNGKELVDRLLRQELFYDPGAHLSGEGLGCERCVDHRDYRMEIAAEIGRMSGHNRFHLSHNSAKGETTGHNQRVSYKKER